MAVSRRQFIIAAASASAVGGVAAFISTGDTKPALVWRGAALGGEARVSLYGTDQDTARHALSAVSQEIERLEQIFSLHRQDSELSHLNRSKHLTNPSRDLVDLLHSTNHWRTRTEGAFDPTVQPLWRALAENKPVSPVMIAAIGTKIEIQNSTISIDADGALTLNGIAQGRIADRLTEILASFGFADVVIDAGELRLPGKNRRAVGIPAAKAAVSVAEVAIATSEPKTLVFDAKGLRHHLINPRAGDCPRHWQSISVFAPSAEMADALSTAFAVLPHEAVADMAASIGDCAVIGRDRKGRIRRFGDSSLTGERSRPIV